MPDLLAYAQPMADFRGMNTIHRAPLFKLCLAFVAGMLLTEYVGEGIYWLGLAAIPCFLYSLIGKKKHFSRQSENVTALLIGLSSMGLGGLLWHGHVHSQHELAYLNGKEHRLLGIVDSRVKTNAYGCKAEFAVLGHFEDSLFRPVHGKLMLYFQPGADSSIQRYDSLWVRAYIKPLNSRYPGYQRYLQRKGITQSGYVKWSKVAGSRPALGAVAVHSQTALAGRISDLIPDSNRVGLAQAMFVGEKSQLQAEHRAQFAAAGLSHILAISGLHIGIIYLVLNVLFAPLALLRHGKRLKSALILLILLGYMLLTGASPAVIRAVLMFGAILVFRMWFQRYHMLNLLAVSAFLQLLYNPTILFEVGFQLSYVAVAGIVLVYPVFESYMTGHPILDKLYGWIGVTISASLFTTPLVIAYFGQFPTYFLLSNILASTLVFVVVLVGFMMVCLAYLPVVGELMGYLSCQLLGLLQKLAAWTAGLPHAVIDFQSLDITGLVVVALELALAGALLMLPRWWSIWQRQQRLAWQG